MSTGACMVMSDDANAANVPLAALPHAQQPSAQVLNNGLSVAGCHGCTSRAAFCVGPAVGV